MKRTNIGKYVSLSSAAVLGSLILIAGPQGNTSVHAADQVPTTQGTVKTKSEAISQGKNVTADKGADVVAPDAQKTAAPVATWSTDSQPVTETTNQPDVASTAAPAAATQDAAKSTVSTPAEEAAAKTSAATPAEAAKTAEAEATTTPTASNQVAEQTTPATVESIWGEGNSSASQERWMTENGSRLIENPTPSGFGQPNTYQASVTDRPTMPLNTAYLGTDGTDSESDVITLSDQPAAYTLGNNVHTYKLDNSTWSSNQGAAPTFEDGKMTLHFDGWWVVAQATMKDTIKPGTRLVVTVDQLTDGAFFELSANAGKPVTILHVTKPGTYVWNMDDYGPEIFTGKPITWQAKIYSDGLVQGSTATVSDMHLDYNPNVLRPTRIHGGQIALTTRPSMILV